MQLAGVKEQPGVVPVAQAVGARLSGKKGAEVELAEALRGKSLLLVLDNCEHLLQAAAALVTT